MKTDNQMAIGFLNSPLTASPCSCFIFIGTKGSQNRMPITTKIAHTAMEFLHPTWRAKGARIAAEMLAKSPIDAV